MNEAITKSYIEDLKTQDISKLYDLLSIKSNGQLTLVLKYLGRLPDDFSGIRFLPLLSNESSEVRLLTVKNIGKLRNDDYLDIILQTAKGDLDSMVRREAVSTIGRMRSRRAINHLIEFLTDHDPKVVVQAMRALLVFKDDEDVQEALKRLVYHPNEMISDAIRTEINKGSRNGKPEINHNESPDILKNLIVNGDVRNILDIIPEESIHLTFTSPPYYNARDYTIYTSYKQYLAVLAEVFKGIYRITKEGRYLLLNTSPIIIQRISRSHSSKRYPIPFDIHPFLNDMGWEFIDDIVWVKPEASAKNRTSSFNQHRKPLAYKPNCITEYIMVYRKKTDKLIDWNIHQYNRETIEQSKVKGKYDTSNVWMIDPVFDKVHTAVFPLELCKRVIEYYSFKGDLVFDPFAGSGTFGKAAALMDRYFFMTENEENYIQRMRQNLSIGRLFTKHDVKVYTLKELKLKIKELENDA